MVIKLWHILAIFAIVITKQPQDRIRFPAFQQAFLLFKAATAACQQTARLKP